MQPRRCRDRISPIATDAERVVGIYERHADAWVGARLRESAVFFERGWLDRFCALVPLGGSVLDIGCGAGKPIATYFGEKGYLVTGVDSSPAMVSMFLENLPGQQAFVADMRHLSLAGRFAGILAWDSFFHLNHQDQRRMFTVFRAHAGPRAALMFTSGPAHGEAIGSLGGEPLFHASFDADGYRKLLDEAGFSVVATIAEDPGCGGRSVWLAQSRW